MSGIKNDNIPKTYSGDGETIDVTGNVISAKEGFNGLLGEIRQFALSITGAKTKAQLQALGWAICDGTTPSSQGISSPTIETTPNLRNKFLIHAAAEVTGGTVTENFLPSHNHAINYIAGGSDGTKVLGANGFTNWNSVPIQATTSGTALVGYTIVYFIKVK